MSDRKILNIMDEAFEHVKFNNNLVKDMEKWRLKWLNKTNDHRLFLGNPYITTYSIFFTLADESEFFLDLFEVDHHQLAKDIFEDKGMDPSYIVGTQVFNVTCAYLIYRFRFVEKISDGAYVAAMLFNYKNLARLHTDYTKFKAELGVAKMVYDSLSGRFLLKKLGSWQNVIEYRAKDMALSKKGVMFVNLREFKADGVVYAVADSQGRMRDILKNVFSILMDVAANKSKVDTLTSSMKSADGDEILKSVDSTVGNYRSYILGISVDETSFIKPELIDVVAELTNTPKTKNIITTLKYIVVNNNAMEISQFLEDVVVYSLSYLKRKGHGNIDTRNIEDILTILRGMWVSRRGTESELLRLRKVGDTLVSTATNVSSKSTVTNTRIAVLVYLMLRIVVKSHYE